MKKWLWAVVLVALLGGLAGAGGTASVASSPPSSRPVSPSSPRWQVAASLPDLAALIREVAGERAGVTSLLSGRQDPLAMAPQPEQAVRLSKADLLVTLGGPLEAGWLADLLPAAHNPRVGEYLDGGRVFAPLHGGGGGEARSCAPGSYPLGDPRQAARMAQAVAGQLALIDPAGADSYRSAAAALAGELAAQEKTWLLHLAPLHGQKVVTYDDSFRAFLCWAGLVEVATLAPAAGVAPGAVQVLRTLRAMRDGGVHLILQREYEPAQAMQVLARKAGAAVVVAPLGARFERGERYADGIDALVMALVGAYHVRSETPRREP